MEEYRELLKLFKIGVQNIQILHRHLFGANWFGDHEQLEEYYKHLQDDVDAFCELGLAIGINEPTMKETIETHNEIEIKGRTSKESYEIVKNLFDEIVAQINRIENQPADVINKLQEAQEYYRLEAEFKLYRATM